MLEIVIADKLSKFRLIVNFWTNDPCSGYQKCSKDLRQPPKGFASLQVAPDYDSLVSPLAKIISDNGGS